MERIKTLMASINLTPIEVVAAPKHLVERIVKASLFQNLSKELERAINNGNIEIVSAHCRTGVVYSVRMNIISDERLTELAAAEQELKDLKNSSLRWAVRSL